MTQTIFRVANRNGSYSKLSNAMIRDGRLSWEARMILVFILSFPENWEFTLSWLLKQPPGFGRDRANRLIGELVDIGYCRRDRKRNGDGTLGAYEYVFYDEISSHWNPVTGEPALEDQSLKRKTRSTKENHKDHRASAGSSESDLEVKAKPARVERFVSEKALDRVRYIAPNWDRQWLLAKFLDWPGSAKARNMDAAFLAWIPKFTKGREPDDAL